MSAETNSVVPAIRAPVRVPARVPALGVSGRQARRVARPAPGPVPRPAPRPVVAVLADGTPAFAPIGEVVVTGTRVICHLCGRALRSVPAHLRVHGYTKEAYCLAFGLERGQSLEGPDTRKLRSTALASRLVFDPAFRAGSAAGRQRARSGELTRDAAAAATGRRHPEQRRRKARQALAGIPAERVAQANAERASRHVAQVAADVARRHGYPDLGAFVLARTADGASLAAISREAGLHKDWLSRHLADAAPAGGRRGAGAAAGPARCPVAARAGPAGIRRCGQLPAGTPRQAAPHGQRHGRRDRRDPSCGRIRAAPSRPGPGRARVHPARGRRARRPGGQPGSATAASAATWANAGRPAGRGGPWPPSPGSPSPGCAATRRGGRIADPAPAACLTRGWLTAAR